MTRLAGDAPLPLSDLTRPTVRPPAGRSPRPAALAVLGASILSMALVAPARAQSVDTVDRSGPWSGYLQFGADGARRSYGIGATRDWPAEVGWSIGGVRLTGYWQGGAEWWTYPAFDGDPSGPTRLVKIEVAPIVRLRGDDGRSHWFVDAGIGLTLTSRLYRSGPTHASSAFNFGDQIAAGWSFGPRREHELALRFEHMSNGGFKQPNPAINTWQLRYARRFGGD